MAKIVFVHYEFRDRVGVMSLSAKLKQNGHQTDVFCLEEERNAVESILKSKPDIVGFSACTSEHKFLLACAGELKKISPNLLILMGGPHATFYPDVIKEPSVDITCRGESDDAIVELLDCLDNGTSFENIKNCCVKSNGNVKSNDVRPLIQDLNSLPFPDRDIYFSKYPTLANNPTKMFLGMRGCPFPCTYCFNMSMLKLYKGKGKYLRLRSPDNFVQEIKGVKERYFLKWVNINDDTFNVDREWLYEFLEIYKKEIALDFLCNIRVDCLDEEMVKCLKDAGCDRVIFGVEHGNEEIRKKILKRNITDEQLINAGKWLRKYNIRVFTTNLAGLPGETVSNFFETVSINRKIGATKAGSFILQPFPSTEIYDYSVSHGYLDKDYSVDDLFFTKSRYFSHEYVGSALKQKDIGKLIKYHYFFHYLVLYPWLEPFIKLLAILPNNRFFELVYKFPGLMKQLPYAQNNRERWGFVKRFLKILVRKIEIKNGMIPGN